MQLLTFFAALLKAHCSGTWRGRKDEPPLRMVPTLFRALIVCSALLFAVDTSAQTTGAVQQIQQLLESLRPSSGKPPAATGHHINSPRPRVSFTADGYVRHLSAPPLHHFPTASAVPGDPAQTARNFLLEHRLAFGFESSAVDFQHIRSRKRDAHNFERFQQFYAGVPVFGAEVIVEVDEAGGVHYVLCRIVRDTVLLDTGELSVTPLLSPATATVLARSEILRLSNAPLNVMATEPRLTLFDPALLGAMGDKRLVWHFARVYDESDSLPPREMLIDAHTGELVRSYPIRKPSLNRTILDHHNIRGYSGDIEREEGDPASGDDEVDHAYSNLYFTYLFYAINHGRDGIDDSGGDLVARVRFCTTDPDDPCPYENAFYDESTAQLYFGDGYATDDVLAHEFTHGVTAEESALIYENQPGAINESFSDIWGEFVDLSHDSSWDDDSVGVRWQIGEDLAVGTLRDMSDPTAFGDPDRMGSPFWYSGTDDGGGVHTNSGVGNKLAYLLTDGDEFSGETILGMGVPRVSDLYYMVQTSLLVSSADYADLYNALVRAATILLWTDSEKNNLFRACQAVEIAGSGSYVFVDGNNGGFENGTALYPYNTVSEAYTAANPGDILYLRNGPFTETPTFVKALTLRRWGTSGAPPRIGGN